MYKKTDLSTGREISLIVSGRVRVYCSAPSGKELTLQIVEKGRLIGETSFLHFSDAYASVCAVNDVTLISCSVERLIPFIAGSEDSLKIILQYLTETNISLARHIKRIAIYNSRQKVASFLFYETQTDNPSGGIRNHTLPYTHEELAVCLGMNRVTVTRILSSFRKLGYIRTAYGKITVLRFELLKQEFENI